jgi:hypothetical protein
MIQGKGPATRRGSGPLQVRGAADWALAGLLSAAALALYVATLAPTVLPGDPGEFQFVPPLLGIAHPTGYPLYCLLGWAWSHLPLSSPLDTPVADVAYRMNLFSAVAAALAAGLVYPTARVLLGLALPALAPTPRRLVAALAAAVLAVTPTLWSQAVIAEVYGLNTLLVVGLLYLLLAWGERGKMPYLFLAALWFGLGLAHHSTTLLLAPAALAYVWLSWPRVVPGEAVVKSSRRGVARWLILAACCAGPLLLYAYIPLRAPHTPYLRQPLDASRELILYENSLPALLDFVTGGPFGASVDLSVDLGERLAMAFGFLRGEVGWIGLALALAGVARLAVSALWPRRPANAEAQARGKAPLAAPDGAPGSRRLLALTGLAFLALAAFNLVYTIGDIYVLFIPVYVVVVLWLAVGAGSLALSLARWRPRAALAVAALFLLPLTMAVQGYAGADQSASVQAQEAWEGILSRPLPAQAVLVTDDRNDIMPMWYLQYVHGRRPDLLGLFPLITGEQPTLGSILDLALSTARPAYLIKEMPGIEVKVEVRPEAGLWRVVGPALRDAPTFARRDRLAGSLELAGYDVSPGSPRAGEALVVRLHWVPLSPLERLYHSYVHLLDANDQPVAGSDGQPGGVFYPSTIWQPGERLADEHVFQVPAGASPGVYRLLAGMYAFNAAGGLDALGEAIHLGSIEIRPAP